MVWGKWMKLLLSRLIRVVERNNVWCNRIVALIDVWSFPHNFYPNYCRYSSNSKIYDQFLFHLCFWTIWIWLKSYVVQITEDCFIHPKYCEVSWLKRDQYYTEGSSLSNGLNRVQCKTLFALIRDSSHCICFMYDYCTTGMIPW